MADATDRMSTAEKHQLLFLLHCCMILKLADGELVIGTMHVDRQTNSTLTLCFRLLVCTSSAAQLSSLFLACRWLAVEQVDCVAPAHIMQQHRTTICCAWELALQPRTRVTVLADSANAILHLYTCKPLQPITRCSLVVLLELLLHATIRPLCTLEPPSHTIWCHSAAATMPAYP